MPSLLDIAPITEEVHGVPVRGISAYGIAQLLYRFPDLRALFTGREVEVDALLRLGPEVIAAIIAAGTGNPGDEAHENAAAALDVGTQIDFLEAILRVTLPNGVKPLMEKAERLMATLGDDDQSTTVQAMRSRKQSRSSLPPDMPMPGTTRPAN